MRMEPPFIIDNESSIFYARVITHFIPHSRWWVGESSLGKLRTCQIARHIYFLRVRGEEIIWRENWGKNDFFSSYSFKIEVRITSAYPCSVITKPNEP